MTSTPTTTHREKRKNEKKIEVELLGLVEESKRARKEIERHLKKRSVADAFFLTMCCTSEEASTGHSIFCANANFSNNF